MRLHLPKTLLAAVLAACAALPTWAETQYGWKDGAPAVSTDSGATWTNISYTDGGAASAGTLTVSGDDSAYAYTSNVAITNISAAEKDVKITASASKDFLRSGTSIGNSLYLTGNRFENGTNNLGNLNVITDDNGNKTAGFTSVYIVGAQLYAAMNSNVSLSSKYFLGAGASSYSDALRLDGGGTITFDKAVTLVGDASVSRADGTGKVVFKGLDTNGRTFSINGSQKVEASGVVGGGHIILSGANSTLKLSGNNIVGTLINAGAVTIGGTYTGSTITQTTDNATLALEDGSVVNIDRLYIHRVFSNSEQEGVQSYGEKQYILATGGSVSTSGTVSFRLNGVDAGGSLSDGNYVTTGTYYYYNILSNTTKSYTQVVADIETDSSVVDAINVQGTLTGVNDTTLGHGILGDGTVQIDADMSLNYLDFCRKGYDFTGSINVLGTLNGLGTTGTSARTITGSGLVKIAGTIDYSAQTFLDTFSGTLEIADGGFMKIGNTTGKFSQLSSIKVTEGGKFGAWSNVANSQTANVDKLLQLAGGTLTTLGGALDYSGAIQVTKDSFLSPDGSNALTVSGDITNASGARITSIGTVTLAGAVTLGDITVQSGSLNLGKVSGAAYAAKDISVGDVTVNAGATFSVGYTKGTVESVSLAAGAKLRYYDNTTPLITEASDTTTIKNLIVSAAATLQADWKGTLNISELTGSGGLSLRKDYNSGAFYLNVDTIKDYSGTISAPTSNGSLMTVTIGGANISDAASTATVSADVTLASGFTKKGEGTVSFTGTTNATDITVSAGSLKLNGYYFTLNGTMDISNGKVVNTANGTLNAGTDQKIEAPLKLGANGKVVISGGSLENDGFTYTKTDTKSASGTNDASLALSEGSTSGSLKVFEGNLVVTNATMTKTATDPKGIGIALDNVKLVLGADTASTTLSGTLTQKLSGVSVASGATLNVENTRATFGSVSVAGTLNMAAVDLDIDEVVLAGGTLTVSGGKVIKTQSLSLTATSGSVMTGSLTLKDGAGMSFNVAGLTGADGEAAICTLTGSLTLGSNVELHLLNLGMLEKGKSITLFTGVTGFTYSGATSVATLSDDDVSTGTVNVDASEIFGNVDRGFFTLNYDGNNVILTASSNVPEPTTATLSLLALMGLAARRRRRKA